MTGPAEWRDDALPSSLLVIAPHPDDDVLGCSLLMRRVTQAGGEVAVAWMTDGGASHGDLASDARRALVERRRAEALAGIAELGVEPVETCFLGRPDGALGADAASIEQIRLRLQALCDARAVDTVVVTDAGDGHPDHRAAFAIAGGLTGVRLYSYPISTRYDGEAYDPPVGAVVISADGGGFKRAALARHRSQSEAEGALHPLSLATIERFCREPEIFIPIPRDGR